MSGRLKIVGVLPNPRPKKKAKRARRMKRRKALRRSKVSRGFILRAIVKRGTGYGHLFWTGKAWSPDKKLAHRSGTQFTSCSRDVKAKLPAGWVSVDCVPA